MTWGEGMGVAEVYAYGLFTSLYSRNKQSTVKQLYYNFKKYFKGTEAGCIFQKLVTAILLVPHAPP